MKEALLLILIVALIVVIIAIRSHLRSRCPNCKMRNTMKEYERKEIKRSKRSQDLGGGQKRYYSLVTYKITYKCENCGVKRTYTKEVEED